MPNYIPPCRKCYSGSVVEANAGVFKSIPYFYCRKCKIEVDEDGYEVKPIKKTKNIEDLESYLSEEMARLDSEKEPTEEEFLKLLKDLSDEKLLEDDDDDDFATFFYPKS